MRAYVHDTVTDLSLNVLWNAKRDLTRWPEYDDGLESVEHDGVLEVGRGFALTPRGGPRVRMTIAIVDAPTRFADVAHLPLAKMRTTTEFLAEPAGTRVRVRIQVTGPLAWWWDRVLARKLAAESAGQTEAFIRHAGSRA